MGQMKELWQEINDALDEAKWEQTQVHDIPAEFNVMSFAGKTRDDKYKLLVVMTEQNGQRRYDGTATKLPSTVMHLTKEQAERGFKLAADQVGVER